MKALTIWQPWASLIAIGAKPYEFRGWAAPAAVRGQRIAIHAGARPVRPTEVRVLLRRLADPEQAWLTCLRPALARPLLERVLADPTCLPLSAVLATAVLSTPLDAMSIVHEFGGPHRNDSDRDDESNYAWPLTDIEPLLPPVEARGAQGFWTWGGA